MKMLVFRYPRNRITDILISMFCIFLIMLIFQSDEHFISTDAVLSDESIVAEYFIGNGWEIDTETIEHSVYVFRDDTSVQYLNYNALQISQGYNLDAFVGKVLDKYSVTVINYPFSDIEDGFYGTVFLYNGEVVASDIYNATLDGFMHGVKKDVIYEQNKT